MADLEVHGYWKGPRWAGVASALKQTAHMRHVECTIEVEKGWLKETGLFTLRGEESEVRAVNAWFVQALKDYNK